MVKLSVGPYDNNVYLISSGGEAVIVDGAADAERILGEVTSRGLTVTAIVETHGHPDHVQALADLVRALDVPVLAGAGDRWPVPTEPLADGHTLTVGDTQVRAIHTPGHTPGSTCYVVPGFLFSGDALFPGGPGKTENAAKFASGNDVARPIVRRARRTRRASVPATGSIPRSAASVPTSRCGAPGAGSAGSVPLRGSSTTPARILMPLAGAIAGTLLAFAVVAVTPDPVRTSTSIVAVTVGADLGCSPPAPRSTMPCTRSHCGRSRAISSTSRAGSSSRPSTPATSTWTGTSRTATPCSRRARAHDGRRAGPDRANREPR